MCRDTAPRGKQTGTLGDGEGKRERAGEGTDRAWAAEMRAGLAGEGSGFISLCADPVELFR